MKNFGKKKTSETEKVSAFLLFVEFATLLSLPTYPVVIESHLR